MKRTMHRLALGLAALLMLSLLSGCRGTPLPEGMDEEELLSAGQEVVELLVAGEYQAVYDLFREDIRSTLTVEQIQALFQEMLEEAGALEGLDDSRVQGSTEGEPHGIAELYYDFAHDTVRFRVAFDLELQLIGVDAPRVL